LITQINSVKSTISLLSRDKTYLPQLINPQTREAADISILSLQIPDFIE